VTFAALMRRGPLAMAALVLGLAVLGATSLPSEAAALHPGVLVGPPAVKSIKVTPSIVSGSGGTATISARLARSATCLLKVVSKPLFKVSVPKEQSCKTTLTAYVKLGANPTSTTRAVALDLVATRGSYSSKALLYVSLAPKPLPITTTTRTTVAPSTTTTTSPAMSLAPPPPGTTTTTPPAPTTTPPTTSSPSPTIDQSTSANWSGYALLGGPFTTVSGTFTVPHLGSDATCSTDESQWVGIDGVQNSDLVQAGIEETETPNGGQCALNQSPPAPPITDAWYEVLPNDPSEVALTMTVNPGDTVTVSISSLSSGWQINVDDVTSSASQSVTVQYSGPATSAEWISEAVTDTSACAGDSKGNPSDQDICPETSYSPPVTYSGLMYGGSSTPLVTAVDELFMVQNGVTVSSPSNVASLSALDANGFTTTYTG
jgi:hypothetical protein